MYEFALATSAVTAVVVFLFIFRRASFNLYNPVVYYFVFHAVIFVIRPILAYVYNYDGLYAVYGFSPTIADKTTVIFASNLGFVAFTFFCMQQGDVAMVFRRDAMDDEEKRRLTQYFIWAWAICGPIALYSLATSASSFAGGDYIKGMILDRGTGAFVNTSSNGYLTDAQFMFATLCAVLAWLGRFRLMALLPTILFVVYRASTGSRGAFVYALMILALLYAYDRKIRLPSPGVLAAILVTIFLFRTVGDDRGASIRQMVGTQAKEQVVTGSQAPALRTLESMDYANMEFFEYLVYVIPQRSHTYDFFLDNFQVFTEPVPRVLWSGKPIGEPFRRIFLFNYGFPIGMTRSLPGEGWYALGWIGVVLWCGLWGGVLGRIYRVFAQGRQTTMKTALYMIYVPMLVTFFRDGLLITFAKQAGMFMLPIGVWWVIARMVGLPRADELRAALLARIRLRRDAGSEPKPDAAASRVSLPSRGAAFSLAMLPPAVRRRREALGRLAGATPAE